VRERDFVTHTDWRDVVSSLTKDDLNCLCAVSRLYDDMCGLLDPRIFPRSEIESARLEIGRARPSGLELAIPEWDSEECVTLLMLRTGLERKVCEAYVDKEMVDCAEAGEIPGYETG
jgi:hypothetical protein